jgi:hypothetical protein
LNTRILNKEVQAFINNNLKSDITKLILKGSPFSKITIQELAEQIVAKKRSEKKLPTWFKTENIYYPNKLNIEQTSSEITANYKSELVSGNTLIDITGGFGIDAFYFSKKIKNVTHCEINSDLSKIVNHNYKQLQIQNINTMAVNGIDVIIHTKNKYDWIYVDPSRRNDLKGKVFLLKDCLPNIPRYLDKLLKKSDNILLKLSPILDLKSAFGELKSVQEIHVVAIENEVKELLFILNNKFEDKTQIKTINYSKTRKQTFEFTFLKDYSVNYNQPKKFLYEPNSAILKSGGFNALSEQLKIDKLQQHSHLYTSDKLIDFPGRRFEIEHIIPYNKKHLNKLIPSKKANITTRNFPETVAQIRSKTKLKDGGNQYLFFTTNLNQEYIVLICRKTP